jgi:DNA-directed RNA polymerase beta subunit
MADVNINGKFVGAVENATDFVNGVIDARRRGQLPFNLNVQYIEPQDSVNVEIGKGRLRRPAIVVKDGRPLLTKKHVEQVKKGELNWDDLIAQGIIEYLDAGEE